LFQEITIMPSTFKSPFTTTFKSGIKRGVPCSVVVQNIANRNNKTCKFVFNSLWKAGVCNRQKMNGQWIYWPCDCKKANVTNVKNCQVNMWQCFVDWCMVSGVCTPDQMSNNCGSQSSFMNYCKKFWGKQFVGTTGRTGTVARKTRTTKSVTSRTGRTHRIGTTGKTTSYRRAA
jgi:hypothetical protein